MRIVGFCVTLAVIGGAVGALFVPLAAVAVSELGNALRVLATV